MNAIAPMTAADSTPATTPAGEPIADRLLNFVVRAMVDHDVNVDKLQMLLGVQRELVADNARLKFNHAMTRDANRLPDRRPRPFL